MPTNTLEITLKFKDDGSIIVDQAKKKFDDLDKTVKDSKGSLDVLHNNWVAITAKIGIATAAFYGAKRIIFDTAKEIASQANDIERQANVLGISTDQLQKWQYAAKMSDVNAQELAMGVKLLSRNMEEAAISSGASANYFSAMNIAIKDVRGNLRPLDDVIGEIMNKFASWEDGPRKIAIAMQLFGRSGETLIPLLNKGSKGFEEFAQEAKKLGIILSPELVQKGSQAEDIFKKLEARSTAAKLSLSSYTLKAAETMDKIVEAFDKIRKWKEEHPLIWNVLFGFVTPVAGPKVGTVQEYLKSFDESLKSYKPPGIQPPVVEDAGKAAELQQKLLEENAKAFGDYADQELAAREKLQIMDVEAAGKKLEQQKSDKEQILEGWNDFYAQRQEMAKGFAENSDYYTKLEVEKDEWTRKQIADGWADFYAEREEMNKGFSENNAYYQNENLKKWEENQKQTALSMERIGSDISRIWGSHLSAMRKGTESFSEGVKGIFTDMADYAISQIEKMAMNYAMFGNTRGEPSAGSGVLGWIGTALGGIVKLQEGGSFWVNRPTPLLVGEGGGREFVTVTPENKMGSAQGQPITIYNYNNYVNISTLDPQNFEEYVSRNPGSIIKVIDEDSKTAGRFRGI